jgi:hypothetical protein
MTPQPARPQSRYDHNRMGYEGYSRRKAFYRWVFAPAFAWLAGPGLAAIVKAVARCESGSGQPLSGSAKECRATSTSPARGQPLTRTLLFTAPR